MHVLSEARTPRAGESESLNSDSWMHFRQRPNRINDGVYAKCMAYLPPRPAGSRRKVQASGSTALYICVSIRTLCTPPSRLIPTASAHDLPTVTRRWRWRGTA